MVVNTLLTMLGCSSPSIEKDTGKAEIFQPEERVERIETLPAARIDYHGHYFFIPKEDTHNCYEYVEQNAAAYELPLTDLRFPGLKMEESGLNGVKYHDYTPVQTLFYEPLGNAVSSRAQKGEYGVITHLEYSTDLKVFAMAQDARPEISLYKCE